MQDEAEETRQILRDAVTKFKERKMSIDAEISAVQVQGDEVRLTLRERVMLGGGLSITGQDWLYMTKPKEVPRPGQIIWGNSGSVFIGSGSNAKEYKRVSYTRLEEI